VRVIGHPARNPEAYQMLTVQMTRPEDGWTWVRHPESQAAGSRPVPTSPMARRQGASTRELRAPVRLPPRPAQR
jgi:hypothetical protein